MLRSTTPGDSQRPCARHSSAGTPSAAAVLLPSMLRERGVLCLLMPGYTPPLTRHTTTQAPDQCWPVLDIGPGEEEFQVIFSNDAQVFVHAYVSKPQEAHEAEQHDRKA